MMQLSYIIYMPYGHTTAATHDNECTPPPCARNGPMDIILLLSQLIGSSINGIYLPSLYSIPCTCSALLFCSSHLVRRPTSVRLLHGRIVVVVVVVVAVVLYDHTHGQRN